MYSRQRKLNRARRVQGFGGLLLATSFFLPAIGVDIYTQVPAEIVTKGIKAADGPPLRLATGVVVFSAAYFFGLLTLAVAFRFVFSDKRREQVLTLTNAALLGITSAAVLLWAFAVLTPISIGTANYVFGSTALIGGGVAVLGLCGGTRQYVILRWHSSLYCIAFLGWFVVMAYKEVRYGMFMSLAGAVLIYAGVSAEARIRTGVGWLVTLGQLATCRLKLLPTGEPRCTKCTYLLIGLTVERCPECGQPFRWSDFASSKKDL